MSRLHIVGGNKISGEVKIQGAKNSVLPILAATLLTKGKCVLRNCPLLSDVESAVEILRYMGCCVLFEKDVIIVDSSGAKNYDIPDILMRKMRSSIMFLGPVMGRFQKARLCFPGGCELGPRPIDIHINAFREMGIKINERHGCISCYTTEKTASREVTLPFPSVGATENIMMFACTLKGITVIENAAKEPEIEDLQNFLNKMGAKIHGAGSGNIVIEGGRELCGAEYKIMPDRIVASTYMSAAAITGGELCLKEVVPSHLSAVLSIFEKAGCKIKKGEDFIYFKAPERLKNVKSIMTMPYPGFPTDSNPVVAASLTKAKGTSVIIETIFQNRFKYTSELSRLGANIKVDSRVCVIEGVEKLYGAKVEATDLRGGAALVVAALGAEGDTYIDNVFYIDRGYENIEKVLTKLGGRIERI